MTETIIGNVVTLMDNSCPKRALTVLELDTFPVTAPLAITTREDAVTVDGDEAIIEDETVVEEHEGEVTVCGEIEITMIETAELSTK